MPDIEVVPGAIGGTGAPERSLGRVGMRRALRWEDVTSLNGALGF